MEKIIDKIEKLQIMIDSLLEEAKAFQESLEPEEDQTYPEDNMPGGHDKEKDADELENNL